MHEYDKRKSHISTNIKKIFYNYQIYTYIYRSVTIYRLPKTNF